MRGCAGAGDAVEIFLALVGGELAGDPGASQADQVSGLHEIGAQTGIAAHCQAPPIGAEGEAVQPGAIAGESEQFLPGSRIPKTGCAIAAGCGNALPIRAEGDRHHSRGVRIQGGEQLPSACAPQPGDAIQPG